MESRLMLNQSENCDCNANLAWINKIYNFTIDLASDGIAFDAKSIRNLWLQCKFGLNQQAFEKISLSIAQTWSGWHKIFPKKLFLIFYIQYDSSDLSSEIFSANAIMEKLLDLMGRYLIICRYIWLNNRSTLHTNLYLHLLHYPRIHLDNF